jgi:23S rRNA (uracil1939-C5)-methyltransferase
VPEVVEILRIAAGGDGVGRLADGLTVFVPRTAPGDRVVLGPVSRHRRFARGVVETVVEPSAERAPPPCLHYVRDRCGGCQLQHLALDAQERVKRAIVGDALRRIGHLDRPDPPIESAAKPLGYRTRISLSSDPTGRRIGYHQFDRPGRIFDLERCEIAAPEVMALWDLVREHRQLLPRPLGRLVLRFDRDGRRHVLVEGRTPTAWTTAGRLASALADRGIVATLWWRPPGGAVRVVAGDRRPAAATAFAQVEPATGERIRAYAVAGLGEVAGEPVWDLYAGVGETSELLRLAGARVESVELDRSAVEAADQRFGTNPSVRRVVGAAEDQVEELGAAAAVVTNPPRTGMDPAVVDAIARSGARRVAYVSCDPATLARDLARLLGGWAGGRIADVRAFDLFPQTAHVETVVVLERA